MKMGLGALLRLKDDPMTDQEMILICADNSGMKFKTKDLRERIHESWNPLEDGKLALGLVEIHGLKITPLDRRVWHVMLDSPWAQSHGNDLKRCIVTCIAKAYRWNQNAGTMK